MRPGAGSRWYGDGTWHHDLSDGDTLDPTERPEHPRPAGADRLPRWLRASPADPERQARVYAGRALLGVLVGCVCAVLLLTAMYPSLRFTNQRPERTTAAPPPPPSTRAALARAEAAPAAGVLRTLLESVPAGMPAGLVDSSPVTGTVSPAVSPTCDTPVSPVLSRSRTWARPPGPGGFGSGVTVTATAYGPGAGAPALDALLVARRQCVGEARVTAASGLGVQTLRASQTKGAVDTQSVMFRRGDVVVSVSGTGVPLPEDAAADLDRRLTQLLTPVCVDQDSTTADFARSPLIARTAFTGLQVARGVDLPGQGSPLPDLVSPHAGTPLPAAVTPTPPQAPYWPEKAPDPVVSPTEPQPPTPYPVQTSYLAPAPDERGPGCGWAFTGTTAPTYDERAAAATQEQRRQAAVTAMQAAVAAYPAAVQAYEQAWRRYQGEAQAYTDYAVAAQEVESAWSAIRAQQEAYRFALEGYQQALAAYDAESRRRQDLATAYASAVTACATVTPPPWTDPAQPSPTAPGCPPTRDPVLDLPPPASPTSPSPPPDPRPTPRP